MSLIKRALIIEFLRKHDVEDRGKSYVCKKQLRISSLISQSFKANSIRWQNVF